MLLPPRVIDPGTPVTVIGWQPGALLAGLPIVLAGSAQGVAMSLAVEREDALSRALQKTLVARGIAPEIAIGASPREIAAPILIGDGSLLDDPIVDALRDHEHAVLAITGLGAEACDGHDPDRAHRRLLEHLADGSLIHRAQLLPFDPLVRTWLEIVEEVHHAVGPAEQRPIVDTIRAALMGRHGSIAVDLAARERKARVSLESASIAYVRTAR